MKTITAPTTRRLYFGPIEVQFAGNVLVEPDKPRLVLYEIPTGFHYGEQAVNELRFTAHDESDREILRRLDYGEVHQHRFGTWARYRAALDGIRPLIGELGWTLTDDERRLVDSLEAYAMSQVEAA
jgi:hypothetical protein